MIKKIETEEDFCSYIKENCHAKLFEIGIKVNEQVICDLAIA